MNDQTLKERFGIKLLDEMKEKDIFLWVRDIHPFKDENGNKYCLMCNKILTGRQRKYCCEDHSNLFYAEWSFRFSWEYIRLGIIARDKNTCQNPNCKKKLPDSQLQVHHIIPKSLGGRDIDSNLITFCIKCHKTKTKNLAKSKTLKGYLGRENQKTLMDFNKNEKN